VTSFERQAIDLLTEIRDLLRASANTPLLDHSLISVTEEYGSSVDEHDEFDGPLPQPQHQSPVGAL